MGGTLEDIVSTPRTLALAARRTTEILSSHGFCVARPPEQMEALLSEGLGRYSLTRDKSDMELKPERIWPEYMLRDLRLDREQLELISEELAFAWENSYFDRRLRPGADTLLSGLAALGFKLGIVSNTASLYQVFDQLEKYGIRKYFGDVTLSSQVGYRKPHPAIFRVSLLQLGSQPQHSVYVGDTISRDVLGSKRAGFACSVLIHSQLTKGKDETLRDAPGPDYTVQAIGEVLPLCKALRDKGSAMQEAAKTAQGVR